MKLLFEIDKIFLLKHFTLLEKYAIIPEKTVSVKIFRGFSNKILPKVRNS